MKLIQVILCLTLVSHLVYCRAIQRDLNTFANICNNSDSEEVMDIRKFNEIFINLLANDGDDIDITNDAVR